MIAPSRSEALRSERQSAATQPDGITTGPDGNLWFTEYNGDRIGRITPPGEVTEFAARGAPAIDRGVTIADAAAIDFCGNSVLFGVAPEIGAHRAP